ncbi:NB-ARC domain-containing protein [Fusarium sp. LHS14.1]|nr:NB-ARC domain-containing protein [Fusarium sp. LHS14.1]
MINKAELAATIAAIIDLSEQLVVLCLEFSAANINNPDIAKLQSCLEALGTALKPTKKVVESHSSQNLAVSQETLDIIDECESNLHTIKDSLEKNKGKNVSRRFGVPSLKWPWKSDQVDSMILKLDRYEQIITLGLEPDKNGILGNIVRGLDNVSHQHLDSACRIGCFSVPFLPNPDFINRPEILKWMKEQYDSHAGRIALVGKDGLGKSQMALQFAEKMHQKDHRCSVFWINGSSNTMVEHSFRSLADTLQLPGRYDPKANHLVLVSDWLNKEEAGPWVMVLDNVEENVFGKKGDGTWLAELLPSRRTGCLIATTSSQSIAESLIVPSKAIYEVDAMTDAQAMRLFRGKINRTQLEDSYDANEARKLVRALDHCPLAISMAAALMIYCAPDMTTESYLDQFSTVDQKKNSLLNKEGGQLALEETALAPVAAWEITFRRMEQKQPSMARLLSLMSLFNPQEIPILGLHRYTFEVDWKAKRKLSNDLDTLRALALVSDSASGDAYQMHPLIQTCTHAWLTQSGKMEYWKRRFLSAMTAQFPSLPGTRNRSTCQAILPHVEHLFDEEPGDDSLNDWVVLLRRCALYFSDTQRDETAIELSKKALAKAEAVWGREDVKTQGLIDHTALFLGRECRFQEEEALLAELVEIRTRTLGDEHTNTLTAMDFLADSYCRQERLKEAEELFLSVIEKQKRTLGEDHHETLTTMRRLACLYRKNNKKEEGLKLFTQLEEVNRDSDKDGQYDTDAVNLAIAHMDFKQYTEAEELLKPAVERLTRTRGHDERLTLCATSVLAGVYKGQQRYKEAIALAQWCLPLLEQVCGQDHQRTVYARSLLTNMRKA